MTMIVYLVVIRFHTHNKIHVFIKKLGKWITIIIYKNIA